MRFGELDLEPKASPGILDTGTWDAAAAWAVLDRLDEQHWLTTRSAVQTGEPLPSIPGLTPAPRTVSRCGSGFCFLGELADGQHVFVAMGGQQNPLGRPARTKSLQDGTRLAMFKADASLLNRFVQEVQSQAILHPLGPVPALGIGTRMTTAVWPGIFGAMEGGRFAANAIQNSVRELYLLDDLVAGQPAERNYAFNFGMIESGYTGSTYEGLWVSGLIAALKHPKAIELGADADHIQVKKGPEGLSHAHRLANAARYYTFYTLDVSDLLDYGALSGSDGGQAYLEAKLQATGQTQAVLRFHREKRSVGGCDYAPTEDLLGRLVGKYWDALDAVQALTGHIADLKDGLPFDLELSIDEHPAQVETFDCLTTEAELAFVLLESKRRGIPLTHVAPNFGVEKGVDYSCPDGLEGLEARIRTLVPIAQDCGVMIDFHSGDDLGPATLRTIQRATGGWQHFKISPSLQLIFADVLRDHHPVLYRRWYDDAMAYARREAEAGSSFAAECVAGAASADSTMPSPYDAVFHNYSFAYVGSRQAGGKFENREAFYTLSPAFYCDYQDRISRHLQRLAAELF